MIRYGHNKKIVNDVGNIGGINGACIAVIPFLILYYLIIINVTSGYGYDYNLATIFEGDIEALHVSFCIDLIPAITLSIISIVNMSKKYYKVSSVMTYIMLALGYVHCISVFRFNNENHIHNISVGFLLGFLVLNLLVYLVNRAKKVENEAVASSLSQSYLIIDETGISGIGNTDATLKNSMSESCLVYDEIYRAYSAYPTLKDGDYYNFYVEHKCGVMKFCIEDERKACEDMRYILNNFGKEDFDLSAYIGKPYSAYHKTETEAEKKEYIEESEKTVCPHCGTKQFASRSFCFKCGYEFNKK